MRGSTPLDVAAASCIDNNELALALQEQELEMVREKFFFKKKAIVELLSDNLSFWYSHEVGGDILGRLWTADVSNALV